MIFIKTFQRNSICPVDGSCSLKYILTCYFSSIPSFVWLHELYCRIAASLNLFERKIWIYLDKKSDFMNRRVHFVWFLNRTNWITNCFIIILSKYVEMSNVLLTSNFLVIKSKWNVMSSAGRMFVIPFCQVIVSQGWNSYRFWDISEWGYIHDLWKSKIVFHSFSTISWKKHWTVGKNYKNRFLEYVLF